MSNLFQSPSSTPQWTSPSGVDESRQKLLDSLNARSTMTQGPAPLQNAGAQMLTGLMGSNFGSAYTTGQNTLEQASQTGLPISLDMLKSLESQRMQQLPEQMAGVTEQLTARGMGGDTDLARILAETAGKAQTDITATLAPYYLQAGEAQAGRQVNAAQQLLPYAQLPVNAALGAVQFGNTMRETADPVVQLLANLASQGNLASTQYGASLGSQLLQAGASALPWLGLSKSLPSLGNMASTGYDWIQQLFGGNGVDPNLDAWGNVYDWGGDVMGAGGGAANWLDTLIGQSGGW